MGPKPSIQRNGKAKSAWYYIVLITAAIFFSWVFYFYFYVHSKKSGSIHIPRADEIASIFKFSQLSSSSNALSDGSNYNSEMLAENSLQTQKEIVEGHSVLPPVSASSANYSKLPVLGPVSTNGAVPLYGVKHQGGDAVFALACNYPRDFYKRFVGSLRKSQFEGDIVLAVSPPAKMKPNVEAYIKSTNVVAYGFDVDCMGVDNCRLRDDFLGYPDPRPFRTFANIRYALYEYWLRYYDEKSYILILDFRDTFFQLNPFAQFGLKSARTPKYELQLYAENFRVKNIGKCPFNSLWIAKCFGRPALEVIREKAVICSGSTLGSFVAIDHYLTTMLTTMDRVKCWLKGIESDQGYQNYLFYNGYFNTPAGNATLFMQGEGVVNTIGAMNGFRVPAELTGSLDKFWKIRDEEGFILNNDGTRSACVHQWDRWYKDLRKFVDTKTYD